MSGGSGTGTGGLGGGTGTGGGMGGGSTPSSGTGAAGSGGSFQFQGRTITVGTPVNVSQAKSNQYQPDIAINPTNPKQLFVAGEDDTNGILGDLFTASSSDGGATWKTALVAGAGGSLPQACCEPVVAFDQFGNLFMAYLDSTDPHVTVVMSVDGGTTLTQVASLSGQGQPNLAVGDNAVWVAYQDTNTILVAAGASVTQFNPPSVTFGTAENVSVPSTLSAAPSVGRLAVGPTGAVAVTYQDGNSGNGPDAVYVSVDPTGLGPNGTGTPSGFGGFVKIASTNVGSTDMIPAEPHLFVDADGNLAWDHSGGPFNGRLYRVFVDAAAVGSTNMSILLSFSDDKGQTWSKPLKVNDDSGATSHFWPHVAVDQTTGNVGLSWYDARNDSSNVAVEYFGAVSFDGGKTISPSFQIANGPSNAANAPNSLNDYGEASGLDFFGGVMHPAWADNSKTLGNNPDLPNFDIATASITITPGGPVVVPPGGGGGGGSSGAVSSGDTSESNNTSDTATNLGTLTTGGVITQVNLSIANLPDGSPDYDWFKVTVMSPGTFEVGMGVTQVGPLEVHLLHQDPSTGALTELSEATVAAGQTVALTSAANPGDTFFVEVKGAPTGPDTLAQGVYNLQLLLV
jgi:hypothetical protein